MSTRRYRIIETNRGVDLVLCNGKAIHYWVPDSGGYIREERDRNVGTLGAQVCQGLATSSGKCLRATPATLASVIRREARSRASMIDTWLVFDLVHSPFGCELLAAKARD